jgi:hypothetical protein
MCRRQRKPDARPAAARNQILRGVSPVSLLATFARSTCRAHLRGRRRNPGQTPRVRAPLDRVERALAEARRSVGPEHAYPSLSLHAPFESSPAEDGDDRAILATTRCCATASSSPRTTCSKADPVMEDSPAPVFPCERVRKVSLSPLDGRRDGTQHGEEADVRRKER